MTREEVLSLIDLLERVRLPAERHFQLADPDPLWNMVIYLMKRHLTGALVTPTSLARAADVPYTTAFRRVQDMHERDFLIYRPRTRSGRSFSVHPSQKLIDLTFEYALGVKAALARTLGQHDDSGSFYLGASYLPARIIPSPAAVKPRLGFGKALDVLLGDDPAYSVSEPLQRQVSYLVGSDVRFHRVPFDEIRVRTLENAALAVSKFDLVAADLTWVGEYTSRGILLPLDDLIAQSQINQADFFPAEWESARSGQRQYGIPFLTNPEILFYRRDMFDAAGLEPPSTTALLLAAARRLHAPKSGVYGVSWAAARGTTVGQAFMQFLADFGQPILDLRRVADGYDATSVSGRQYVPQIDTPRGHATARYMLELLEFSPPGILEMSWDQQVELINAGRVAMSYEWAARTSRLLPASPAMSNVGFLPHPVGSFEADSRQRDNVSPVGGFVLGIPANIDAARLMPAWRAVEWFTSPEIIKLFAQYGGGHTAPRFSVVADPQVRRLSAAIPAVDAMAKRGQLRLWPRPPVAELPAIVAILGEEVHDMLGGRQSIGSALASAQQRVDALMRANQHY